MKKLKYIYLLSIAMLTFSCGNKRTSENNAKPSDTYEIQYAKGFSVNKYLDYTQVTVNNLWDTASILQTYILVDKNKELPSNLPQGKVIRTPFMSVVAYSTIHSSTLNELASVGIITGVCESEYMDIKEIQDGVKSGKIKDFGMANNPDVEQIMLLSPDAIFASPISGQSYGNVEKIGIPIIETPDYLESQPLARAEWIRFYSLFIGKEELADSLFATTARNYNEIKELVDTENKKPRILTDQRYMGTWNMAGGKSYMANMLADAGGDYIWADNESSDFLPLSFETVLDKGGDADIWLMRYYSPKEMTYTSLSADYKPYSYFEAYKNKNIWGCNTMNSKYYEDLPIHPEYILKDFAYIFNPSLFPDYTPKYFQKLKD